MVLKNSTSYCLLLFFLFITSVVFAQEFYPLEQAKKNTIKIVGDKNIALTEISSKFEVITESSGSKQISIYKITNSSSGLNEKYIVFTSAKGRFEYFDYAIIVNEHAVVENIRIVKYRSEHGTEITSTKWLSQFIGASIDNLEYGKDIQALSGASISAKSITEDIPLTISIFRNSIK